MKNIEKQMNIGYVSHVEIIDVEKRFLSGPKHYVFVIQVTWAEPANIFIVYRRYGEFFDLQCKLLELFSESQHSKDRVIPFLPGKIILRRSQIRQRAIERKVELNKYCQMLIALPQNISKSKPILDFFQPHETDIKKPEETVIHEKKIIPTKTTTISQPLTLPKYRCLSDFKATDSLELTVKRGTILQILQKHQNGLVVNTFSKTHIPGCTQILGWWFVQNRDQRGFVPGAFLEPIDQSPGARESKTVLTGENEIYLVNKSYCQQGPGELSITKGSFVNVIEKSLTGWWTVKFNKSIGVFPSVYLTDCEGRHIPQAQDESKAKIENLNANDSDGLDDSDWDEDEDDESSGSIKLEPEIWYAHSSYIDERKDCLSFHRGDRIEIHRKYSNGWWSGRALTDDHHLTWIASTYLQKDPVECAMEENQSSSAGNREITEEWIGNDSIEPIVLTTIPDTPVLEKIAFNDNMVIASPITNNLPTKPPRMKETYIPISEVSLSNETEAERYENTKELENKNSRDPEVEKISRSKTPEEELHFNQNSSKTTTPVNIEKAQTIERNEPKSVKDLIQRFQKL